MSCGQHEPAQFGLAVAHPGHGERLLVQWPARQAEVGGRVRRTTADASEGVAEQPVERADVGRLAVGDARQLEPIEAVPVDWCAAPSAAPSP